MNTQISESVSTAESRAIRTIDSINIDGIEYVKVESVARLYKTSANVIKNMLDDIQANCVKVGYSLFYDKVYVKIACEVWKDQTRITKEAVLNACKKEILKRASAVLSPETELKSDI